MHKPALVLEDTDYEVVDKIQRALARKGIECTHFISVRMTESKQMIGLLPYRAGEKLIKPADFSMAFVDGWMGERSLQGCQLVQSLCPHMPCIAISGDTSYNHEMVKAGACGSVPKDRAPWYIATRLFDETGNLLLATESARAASA